jgi:hypothetical protein
MQAPIRMAGQNLAQSLGVPYPDSAGQARHGVVDSRSGQTYQNPMHPSIAMAAHRGAFASE